MRPLLGLTLSLLLLGCGGDDGGADDASGTESTSETGDPTTTGDGDPTTTGDGDGDPTTTGDGDGDGDGEPGNLLLSDQTLNIAHRGGARLRPEETLLAFENALAVGADVIEFDLHASSDGVIVLMHDGTVDRTTDGSGAISDMSFDELRMLDAGYSFTTDGGQSYPYRGMGVQIARLEEVFETFPDRYYLMEIKQDEPSIVTDLLQILADYEVEERVVIASFNQVAIDEVRAQNPELFTAMTLPEMVDFYQNGANPDYVPPALFVQTPWDVVDQELVDRSHALGLKVQPWTVNGEALMLDLIGYGVDGIMTDDPALLDSVL